jgi:3-phosphoshikimate 1-carboxyvinyltransferase
MVYFHFLNFSYVLDGVPRMRERPIGDLVVGLKQLGADVDCFLGTDCPPVRVKGIGGLPGGKVSCYNLTWVLHSYVTG